MRERGGGGGGVKAEELRRWREEGGARRERGVIPGWIMCDMWETEPGEARTADEAVRRTPGGSGCRGVEGDEMLVFPWCGWEKRMEEDAERCVSRLGVDSFCPD